MRYSSQKTSVWPKILLSDMNNVTGGVMLEEQYMHYRVEETISLRVSQDTYVVLKVSTVQA